MRFLLTTAVLCGIATVVAGHDKQYRFRKPRRTDVRSPCPLLNALANHGYLPRNGMNVSLDQFVDGIGAAINFDAVIIRAVATSGLPASTTGYNDTVNLDDLNEHNVIEHDGSLSRADIYTGDNYSFNPKIWRTVTRFFNKRTISIDTAARARAARLKAAAVANPKFNMTAAQMQLSTVETALYQVTFGDPVEGNAVTKYVDYFFRNERLPYELGWKRPRRPITGETIVAMAARVAAVPI